MDAKAMGKLFAVMAAGLFLGALILPSTAGAIEVKKSLYTGSAAPAASGPAAQGPAPKNPLTAAQRQALQDAVANDSEQFLDQESEKKSSGEPYLDLEHAKFSYVPGSGAVTAKLEAQEYKLKKGAEGKGSPTGIKKALVFKYKIEGNKLAADGEPKWEEVAAKK